MEDGIYMCANDITLIVRGCIFKPVRVNLFKKKLFITFTMVVYIECNIREAMSDLRKLF